MLRTLGETAVLAALLFVVYYGLQIGCAGIHGTKACQTSYERIDE